MIIRVFFPASPLCTRTLKFTDVEPDRFEVVEQIVAEIRAQDGSLWRKMSPLPPHVLRWIRECGQRIFPAIINIDGTTYLVDENDRIFDGHERSNFLEREDADPFDD